MEISVWKPVSPDAPRTFEMVRIRFCVTERLKTRLGTMLIWMKHGYLERISSATDGRAESIRFVTSWSKITKLHEPCSMVNSRLWIKHNNFQLYDYLYYYWDNFYEAKGKGQSKRHFNKCHLIGMLNKWCWWWWWVFCPKAGPIGFYITQEWDEWVAFTLPSS